MKFKDEIYHQIYRDKEAMLDIVAEAISSTKVISKWLEEELKQGYCYRNDKKLEGSEYENEINKLKSKSEVLTELFKGKNCQRYILDKEVIGNRENQSKNKEYDLGFYHLGNGLSVANKSEIDKGTRDYKKLAHINTFRKITYYEKNLPENIKKEIEKVARTSNMTISQTQEQKVFQTPSETEDDWEEEL